MLKFKSLIFLLLVIGTLIAFSGIYVLYTASQHETVSSDVSENLNEDFPSMEEIFGEFSTPKGLLGEDLAESGGNVDPGLLKEKANELAISPDDLIYFTDCQTSQAEFNVKPGHAVYFLSGAGLGELQFSHEMNFIYKLGRSQVHVFEMPKNESKIDVYCNKNLLVTLSS